MEMLNNIWDVLCAENAKLISFLLFPLYFIEAFFIMMLFLSLLNIKCSNKQKLLYIILSALCSIITTMFIPSPFNVICNYIIVFALIYYIFKHLSRIL